MENPALGGASESRSGEFDLTDDTRPIHDPQAACRAIEAGLAYLPDACDLAAILRRRLDLPERVWLTASGILSLPEDTAEAVSCATLADTDRHRLTPRQIEVERQRRAWVRYIASKTPYERRRAGR